MNSADRFETIACEQYESPPSPILTNLLRRPKLAARAAERSQAEWGLRTTGLRELPGPAGIIDDVRPRLAAPETRQTKMMTLKQFPQRNTSSASVSRTTAAPL